MPVLGYAQGATIEPLGSELTADVAAGSSVWQVEWTGQFDDDGGTLTLNDVVYTYSAGAIDEDALTITLDGVTAADATTGDAVTAVAGGKIISDLVLHVSCGDGDDVEVVVPFRDRDLWPEGEYDEPVQVLLSDDLETIIDVPGRRPERDLADNPAITEIAETVGAFETTVTAVEADIEAAYDALDGFTFTLTTKSQHFLSPNAPTSADANNAGDVWEQQVAGKIVGRWRGAGGTGAPAAAPYSWTTMNLDATYIPMLDIGTGTFGDLTGFRLASDAIETRHLTVGMVNGLILTGSAIQTSDQGPPSTWTVNGGVVTPHGIKITNSGLVAYNGSGVATSAIDASTGRMTAVGGFSTASGWNDILITAGTSSSDPSALRFYSVSPGVDNTLPASLSATHGTSSIAGTPVFYTTLSYQGAKYGTIGVGGSPRPRIDIHTLRDQSDPSTVRADISYHAGASGSFAGSGKHTFFVDGVDVGQWNELGIALGGGRKLTIGQFPSAAAPNGIYTLGNIRTDAMLEAGNGLFDYGAVYVEGWSGLTCKWNAGGRVGAITSTRETKDDITPLTVEEARTALAMVSYKYRYRPEQEMGDALHSGHLADQAAEAGAELWVIRDPDGVPKGIEYGELASAHNLLIKDLLDRIEILEGAI